MWWRCSVRRRGAGRLDGGDEAADERVGCGAKCVQELENEGLSMWSWSGGPQTLSASMSTAKVTAYVGYS